MKSVGNSVAKIGSNSKALNIVRRHIVHQTVCQILNQCKWHIVQYNRKTIGIRYFTTQI